MFTNASFKWKIKTSFNYIFVEQIITYMKLHIQHAYKFRPIYTLPTNRLQKYPSM